MKLAIILFLLILGIGMGIYYNFFYDKPIQQNKFYQGPVPEGYNETHFRLIGKTIKNG